VYPEDLAEQMGAFVSDTEHAKPEQAATSEPAGLGWSDVWQLPTLVLGVGVLVAAIMHAMTLVPRPDVSAPLARAEEQVAASAYEDAITTLNTGVYPFVGTKDITREQQGAFHQLMGRALYLGQRGLGIDREDNNTNIKASYLEAEAYGVQLLPSDVSYLADTLLSLGEFDQARKRADTLPADERSRRLTLYRRLVDEAMNPDRRRDDAAFELVSGMLMDTQLAPDDRAWALSRQAELQIDRGYAEDAMNRLLRELPRLDSLSPRERGPLHLLLARAYIEVQSLDSAERQLALAAEMIQPGDIRIQQLTLLQGQVLSLKGDHAAARERFQLVLDSIPTARWRLWGEYGLAKAASIMDDDEDALAAYGRLVELLAKGEKSREVSPVVVAESLTKCSTDRFEHGSTDLSLRYAVLAERVLGESRLTAETLLSLASSHRRLADEIIAAVKAKSTSDVVLADLDPATRAQVRSHLSAAAGYYRKHADKVVLTDVQLYSDSLWMSGDCYDRAGDQESAVRIFQLYAAERPGDPRQPEARFRLAQAYQVRGDIENAAAIYRDLIRSRGDAESGSGPWADASEVPLARALLLDANTENDAEAEQILRSVVSGQIGGPDSASFRAAVFELANYYYRKNDYDAAIERFEEALTRYPDDSQVTAARFKLGDALRLSAVEIEQTLTQAIPPAEKVTLEATRVDRLRRAIGLYEQVRRELDVKDPRRRTAAEETYLRNSYFYMGEAAFRMKDYEAAITHYNAAKDRYNQDPAALVAMTQIVSCHLRQGDLKRAQAANERAKRFYSGLPVAVWDDPTLPMTRQDWERWLDSTSRLWADAGPVPGTQSAAATDPNSP
jgi:TolA-binding protein